MNREICLHRKFATSISARKFAVEIGLNRSQSSRRVRKCTLCGKWRISDV